MKYLLLISFIFTLLTLKAQVRGKVIDSTSKKPLAYASVYFKNAGIGTYTNTDGVFQIPTNSLSDTLLVSYVGYKNVAIPFKKDTVINIQLEQTTFHLSEIKIVNYDEYFLADIIHSCIIKHTKFSNDINCKSFAKLSTYQEDTLLCESFEAFYNSNINAFWIKNNIFKNGSLLQTNKENTFQFQTLDLYSFIIPNLEIYVKPTSKRNTSGTIYYIQNVTNDIYFASPINSYFVSDILNRYKLLATKISNSDLKISYVNKVDTNIFGYLVVNVNEKRFTDLSLNKFYAKYTPIKSTNENYKIDSLLLTINIAFQDFESNYYPNLITTKFSFNYVEKANLNNKNIDIISEQVFYDFGNTFTPPLPSYLSQFNEYQSLSIVPIIPELWKNELVLVKTETEIRSINNMHKFNETSSNYCVWTKDWQLDWDRVVSLKKEIIKNSKVNKFKIVKANAFVFLDYYKVHNQFIINTAAVLDYSTCRIPIDEKTKEMKIIIENYFSKIHIISINLENKLNSEPDLTHKLINKYFRKTNRKSKLAKKDFTKAQRRYFIKVRKANKV